MWSAGTGKPARRSGGDLRRFSPKPSTWSCGLARHARPLSVGIRNQTGDSRVPRHLPASPAALLQVLAPSRARGRRSLEATPHTRTSTPPRLRGSAAAGCGHRPRVPRVQAVVASGRVVHCTTAAAGTRDSPAGQQDLACVEHKPAQGTAVTVRTHHVARGR
jgi:hypothetical protein